MVAPTDPNYGLQGQYGLIGDIETIWDEYNGAGVHVAVFDDGVESTHSDLAGNYDDSIQFTYNGVTYDSEPNGPNNGHGTACAGIIGAVGNNGIGGAGVAWGVTLTGVDYLVEIQNAIFAGGGFNAGLLQAVMEHTVNFDVVSNSWGSDPLYASFQDVNNSGSSAQITVDAFEYASANGRDGLGTIINQAAGNETLNLNGSGVNGTRFTVSVAATDLTGNVEDYSNWGAAMLVSAPAINYTTDLSGSDGYDAGDFTQGFNGTSAATPVISGVVALMLEAESGLGWRDVQNILAMSASHTGSAFGGLGTGDEVGDWFSNGADNWNGGGQTFHLSYGFGMVDAFAAVRMAEAWLVMHEDAETSANEVHTTYDGDSLFLADTSTVSTSITVGAGESIMIEDITVTLDVSHTYPGDITVVLIAPDGTEFTLFIREGGGNDIDFTWSFGITGALGMASEGVWTIQFTDSAGGDTGNLADWDLDFYGTEISSDDVYHFTDDFLMMQSAEGGRNNLIDDGQGEDWINMSAIAGRALLVMGGASGRIEVDGTFWSDIAATSAIENAYMGDGNDRVIGNGLNNEIHGARGSDRLEGRGGDDVLNGGAGADTLDGGSGLDLADYSTSDRRVKVDLNDASANAGDAAQDTFISIEGVIGTDFRDTMSGDNQSNVFIGGNGNDFMYGRGGDDILDGGDGADRLNGGGGTDIASYASSENGITADLNDSSNNRGDANGDIYVNIEGLSGTDRNDDLSGDSGDNILIGLGGQDELVGRNGDDVLNGGEGRDLLVGGGGRDFLSGGDDSDRDEFRYNNEFDSGVGGAARDRIIDFDRHNDVINLSRLDADSTTGGNQDFDFIGNSDFSGTAGELRFVQQNGRTIIQADTDGDGVRDFEIELTGTMNLHANDFIL